MPRRPRVVVPGIAHHITQRGNNRQPVFDTSEDRALYLDLLSRHAVRHGAHILAYCLMTNHVHLVMVPDGPHSLARTLRQAHSEYALAVNRMQGRSGHLWQCRFFSCPLDRSHLENAIRYVDLNPVRAGLVEVAQAWSWSSARAHTDAVLRDEVLACGWREYLPHGWNFGRWKEMLATSADAASCDAIRRATQNGEPLGPRDFVVQLERRLNRRLKVGARGRPKKRTQAPEDAERQRALFGAGGDGE